MNYLNVFRVLFVYFNVLNLLKTLKSNFWFLESSVIGIPYFNNGFRKSKSYESFSRTKLAL